MITSVFNKLYSVYKWRKFQSAWKSNNRNNFVKPQCYVDIKKISIGNNTYGELFVVDETSMHCKLVIGSYCSLGPKTVYLLAGEHNLDTISTYPFRAIRYGVRKDAKTKGNIIVKDDVWIGFNAVICSGVTIGQGAVVAAGAVVTKDVPPYAIVGGNPAKVIRFRLDESLRERLLNQDITRLFDSFNEADMAKVYSCTSDDIYSLLKSTGNVD